jgi:hypothetical protein
MAARELPIACSLGSADLAARLAAMRAVGEEGCLNSRLAATTAVLTFRASVRARVEAIVAAEQECCAFLEMSLHDAAPGEFELMIAAPQGAELVLRELVEAFAGPRAATRNVEPRHSAGSPATVWPPKAH